jgi:Mn2+/Fe2+ NRAMP family transporter
VLLVLVIKLANDKRLMGEWVNGKLQNIFTISLTGLISLVTVALLFFSV